jgi:hypothetical protein
MHSTEHSYQHGKGGPAGKTGGSPRRKPEELLAELASAASRVTQQGGAKGAFIDVELDLWYAAQARMRPEDICEDGSHI